MKNISRKFLITLIILSAPVARSLNMITEQNPFADINKLGTVVKPGESISIQTTNGTVTIEYAGPTKRRITWNGEAREISLFKSSILNGIYRDRVEFDRPIGDIRGVAYIEHAITFSSYEEYKKFLYVNVEGLHFEHRINERLIVNYSVDRSLLRIGILKYKLPASNAEGINSTEKGSP